MAAPVKRAGLLAIAPCSGYDNSHYGTGSRVRRAVRSEVSRRVHVEEHVIELSAYPRRYVGYAASPFRYPGGKGVLTEYLRLEIVRRFGSTKPAYAEPFCGGAGAAVNLLVDDAVAALYLNDADHRIYSAWRAMLHETDRFLSELQTVDCSLKTWEKCLEIVHRKPQDIYSFEVGFAAFFINRTSRSGVLLGSGPIGGYHQEGRWKIGARFNKATLSKRISKLHHLNNRIFLSCKDGVDFCVEQGKTTPTSNIFFFIDPPYVSAGGRLYYDGMSLAKHDALALWIKSGAPTHWILTYDDHPLVRENFDDLAIHKLQVRYSLASRRVEGELLYMSDAPSSNEAKLLEIE